MIRSFKDQLPATLEQELNRDEKDLLCRNLNEPLAFVCENHNRPDIASFLEREMNQKQRFKEQSFDIALITALVQLFDVLDMDKRRLDHNRFKDSLELWLKGQPMETIYEDNDWKRFFQCHFIENVRVDPVGPGNNIFRLSIDVRFNTKENPNIQERLLEIYRNRLQKSRYDCMTVINKHADMHFITDYPFNVLPPAKNKAKIPGKLEGLFLTGEKKQYDKFKGNGSPPLLMGRDRDLNKLKEMIREMGTTFPKRAITLKGAPGIGKTALTHALLQQREVISQFPDGSHFISLEGVYSKENLVLHINSFIGISSDAKEESLMDYIGNKQILMVLDNFEDPLTDRSETLGFMRNLLEQCRGCVIVCTSREAMKVAAIEIYHQLNKLDRESSRDLLISLAQSQGFDKEYLDGEIDVLLDLLDDLPLAISLAAPYLAYGVGQLVSAVCEQGVGALKVLDTAESNEKKYLNLARCIELSFRTIHGTDTGLLFLAASLFPAGLSPADMKSLLPGFTFQQLVTLESKSLVYRIKDDSKEQNYTMLAPLRQYGFRIFKEHRQREKIEKGWGLLIMKKSREYKKITLGKGSLEVNRLIVKLPNILFFLDFLLGIGAPCKNRIFELLENMYDFLRFQGMYGQALAYLKQARQLAVDTSDKRYEALSLYWKGGINYQESKKDVALKTFKEAIKLYKEVGDWKGEADCILSIGDIHFRGLQIQKALNVFKRAMELFKKMGDWKGEAKCIYLTGEVHYHGSRNNLALQAFKEAIELYKKEGLLVEEANCIRSIGDVHFQESRYQEALKAFERAMKLFKNAGQLHGEANCIKSIGNVHFQKSSYQEAKKAFKQAMKLFKDIKQLMGEANCIRSIGEIHLQKSQNKEALREFKKALALYKKDGHPMGVAGIIFRIGETHLQDSRNKKALKAFDEALILYKKMGSILGEANCINSIGQALIKEGDIKKGYKHFEQSLNHYKAINHQLSIAQTSYDYALLLKEIPGHEEKARELFQTAANIFKTIKLPQNAKECEAFLD